MRSALLDKAQKKSCDVQRHGVFENFASTRQLLRCDWNSGQLLQKQLQFDGRVLQNNFHIVVRHLLPLDPDETASAARAHQRTSLFTASVLSLLPNA